MENFAIYIYIYYYRLVIKFQNNTWGLNCLMQNDTVTGTKVTFSGVWH